MTCVLHMHDWLNDFLVLITGGIYWSVVECGVGLVSACLPTVYGALRRQVAKTWKNMSGGRSSEWAGYGFRNPTSRGYKQRKDSESSQIELAGYPRTVATANGDVHASSLGNPPLDQILVKREMETMEDQV